MYNNNGVYYDSYTFCYSTLGIPVLYLETVPPRLQPEEESPWMNHSDLTGGTNKSTHYKFLGSFNTSLCLLLWLALHEWH